MNFNVLKTTLLSLVAKLRGNALSVALLALAIAFNLLYLAPEVAGRVPVMNDEVLHRQGIQHALDALNAGQNPTDVWFGNLTLGYPLFQHYQHLVYAVAALLYWPLQHALALADFMSWSRYLLLSLFPLALFAATRRLGFTPLTAAVTGALGTLLATNGLYGFDYLSYVWSGFGLYTQLWGMFLAPLALACGVHTLRSGRGFALAGALLAATLLAHLVLGYIVLISLAAIALLQWVLVAKTTKTESVSETDSVYRKTNAIYRLIGLFILIVCVSAYFLLPYVQDGAYMNRSVWERADKYDAYGASWTLTSLADGALFDFGRFPSLTILLFIGLVLSTWRTIRQRDLRYGAPVLVFGLWLVLYFGRPTWGVWLDLLPLSHDLHFHRLIAGVHLGGIFLIGIGASELLSWAFAKTNRRYHLAAGLAVLLVLLPVLNERATYYIKNRDIRANSQQAYLAEATEVEGLIAYVKTLPPGRIYAGLAARWGKDYRVGDVPMYALLSNSGLDTFGFLYHALALTADTQVEFNDGLIEQYNLFNIRYVVLPTDWKIPAFYKPLRDFGRHRLYQVDTTGYFDLVSTTQTLVGQKNELYPVASKWLGLNLVGAKQHPIIVLDGGDGGQTAIPLAQGIAAVNATRFVPNPTPPGQITQETAQNGAFAAAVNLKRDSTLMLKTTYDPGWQATVDGVGAPTLMLMPGYVGVKLAAGAHQVNLTYQPAPLRTALMVFGLLVLLMVAVLEGKLGAQLARSWRARVRVMPRVKAVSSTVMPAQAGGQELLEANGLDAAWVPAFAGMTDGEPGVDEALRVTIPAQKQGQSEQTGQNEALRYAQSDKLVILHPAVADGPVKVGARFKLGLYLLFLSVYFLTSAGHFFATDHVSVFQTARSLVERHDLAIDPILDTAKGPDGRSYSVFGLGQALAEIPLYVLGRTVDQISSPTLKAYFSGMPLGIWGGTVPIYFVSLFNQLLMPLLCVLLFSFCLRLGFTKRIALISTLMFGFGTQAWVYSRDSFQHPLETLTILSSVYILFVQRDRLQARQVLLAGAALAYGVLTRFNLITVIPVLAAYVLALAYRSSGHSTYPQFLKPLIDRLSRYRLGSLNAAMLVQPVLYLIPVGLTLCGMMVLNQVRWGRFLAFEPVAEDNGFSTPLWLGLYGNLFSLGRSIFLYSPPLILALWSFKEFYRRYRIEAILFGALGAVYLLLYSMYGHWHGDFNYGPRFLLLLVPLGMLPLGYALINRRRMALAAGLTAIGVVVQLLGTTVNYSFVYGLWSDMRLMPKIAYLFEPNISPIAMHVRELLAGRNIDLWLREVYLRIGPAAMLATLLLPLALFGLALVLLGVAQRSNFRSLVAVFKRIGQRMDALTPQRMGESAANWINTAIQAIVVGPSSASAKSAIHTISTRTKLGLYLLFFSVYFMSGGGHFFSGNPLDMYRTTQSLVERHDLAILKSIDTVTGVDGRDYSVFGIGQPIAQIPFYVVGKAVEQVASPEVTRYITGWPGSFDNLTSVTIHFVSLLNQFLMPLLCLLLLQFCLRLGFSPRRAIATTLVFGFGTAAWVYARDSFQHTLETLMLLLAIYQLFVHRDELRPRHALLAGVAFGYGVLTRVNLLFCLPALFVYLLILTGRQRQFAGLASAIQADSSAGQRLWRLSRQWLLPAARQYLLPFVGPALLITFGIMLLNQMRFGSLLAFNPIATNIEGFVTPLWAGLYGNLFSVGRSIFLYSPPIILALWSFKAFYRNYRAEAVLFGVLMALYLFVYSQYRVWHGGWSFGPRFLFALVPLCMLPLGYFLTSWRRAALAAGLTVIGMGIQFLGITVNYNYLYQAWTRTNFVPAEVYLFQPDLSPIAAHVQSLLAGRYFDLWLDFVLQNFGVPIFLATIAVPLAVLALALRLLDFPALLRKALHWLQGLPAQPTMQRLTAGIAAMREGYSSATVTRPWVAHLPYIAVLIVLVLLAGAPLLRLQAFSGHDATEYLPRNVEFYRGLQDGQLLPRWAPDLSGGHGQPLFNFNPPVIYYATALFHALGAGFSAAESLACLALLLLAAIGMYVFGQSLFGRPAGLISGTAYIFAPYFLLVLYVRHALADFAIFAFMPFAFWGLYRYISTARPRYLAVGAGAVGLMSLSSNPVALITMPALLALPLWFAWIRRDRRIARSMVLRGAWCLTLGMGLSAFFWLPALAERDYVHIQRLLESFLNYQNHFVSFQQLIYSPWGYGLSVLGTEDGMSFAIGTIHLVLIVVAAGLWWQQRRAASATKAMLGFMLVFLAYAVFMSLDASQFVWDRLSLLQYLEYPWRFHSLVAFSSAVLCGAVLHGLSVYRPALTGRASIALVVGLLLFNLALAKPEQYPTIDESWYSPVNIAASYIDVNTANEYDPVWVQTRPSESVKTPLTFLQGTGRLRETTLAPITRRYEIELTSKARLRENTFYFPGWKLYVDGAEQTIDYSNQYGLMDFELGPGRHSIRFEFVNTPVRTWGWWVTIFTLLLVIIFVGFNTFKRLVVRWIKGSNTLLRQPLAQR